MKKATVSIETFTEKLSGLIASGVTFEATETNGMMVIVFAVGF